MSSTNGPFDPHQADPSGFGSAAGAGHHAHNNPYYGGQYPYPGYPQPYGPYQAGHLPRPTNGLAIAALVTSLGSIMTCGAVGVIGAILGHVALNQLKSDGKQGYGMALTGVIVGWVLFVGFMIIMGVALSVEDDDSYNYDSGY